MTRFGLAIAFSLHVVFPIFAVPIIAAAQTVVEDSLVEPSAADAVAPEVVKTHSVLELIMGSGAVVQGVLMVLLIMSIATWGIVFTKYFALRNARRQSRKFEDVFWTSKNLAQINEVSRKLTASPLANVYCSGHKELTALVKQPSGGKEMTNDFDGIEIIDRALKRAKAEEVTRLETGTTFLATTASAAPFIGLFGTVWGIMNAFIGLSQVKSSSIQAVAPGISEALIATAIGLAAAIPAAIFYNYFMQQVRLMSRNVDMFSAEFLNIARRHFLK